MRLRPCAGPEHKVLITARFRPYRAVFRHRHDGLISRLYELKETGLSTRAVAEAARGFLGHDEQAHGFELMRAADLSPHLAGQLNGRHRAGAGEDNLVQPCEGTAALSLAPCFTPVRSPESSGVSEASVKDACRRPTLHCLEDYDGRKSGTDK